jgi:IS30 family transposase
MASHLTLAERDRIAKLKARQCSNKEIAAELGRVPSTISRELKRNASGDQYFAGAAQQMAQQRRRDRPLARKCERSAVDHTLRRLLACRASPEEIAARMKHERPERPEDCVCASSIYRWIEQQGAQRAHWRSFLRRRGKRPYRPRKPSADAAQKARIDQRPTVIEERQRLGDFEGDLVLGQPGSGGLQTLVDRQSRYTLLMKVKSKRADYIQRKTRQRLKTLPADKRHSITYDNGGEFALCRRLERSLGMKLYWAQPGCPYQRGTNENTNGLARQFFPKGIDFRTVSHARTREVESLLNHRPRKCLGWRTPYEAFHNTSEKLCCD